MLTAFLNVTMRILHLDSGREMRGGQWQVLRLMEGLRRESVDCTLLSPLGSPLWDHARARSLNVRPLGLWAVHRLSRQADLVHAHDARAHTLAAVLSGAPLVVSRRVAFPIRSRWKYRHASRYAAVSQFVKGVMIEGGVPEDKISVVYDGVPLGETAAGAETRLETVVAPASGDPRKGTALALEATRRAGVDLLLSRDLESDLAGASLFLYLTHAEGLGSAILMAMAAGVPVIASNVGGIPEIVRHRENGWLTENQPEPIAAAIRELLGDRPLARGARHARTPNRGGKVLTRPNDPQHDPPIPAGAFLLEARLLEACLALLFGLLIGSFLNVCIYRLPQDLSVVRPRSYCPACNHPIAWYDNVPLLSYALLRGRCRHCHASISVRYPIVELLTGALFFVFVWRRGTDLAAVKFCLLSALLVGLTFADLEARILPDEFTLGGIAAGLVLAWFVPVNDEIAQVLLWLAGVHGNAHLTSLAAALLGAILPGALLWFGGWLYFKMRHREGLGLGDVKLVAMVGAFLGLHGALLMLIGGSLAGSLIGYAYIRFTHKDPATYELPFGTFLGLAGIAVALASSGSL